ncbi:putative receptor-like protein kinase At3g47110 [Rhodamnia argentea]|uniref:non-specific serine/threonine protein kinase n=1 Tax=Rhodamnia argentea TaxID=178133 RepID=A0A8B8NUQ9_9MYRT|nr:putative receptor-like protein kinase At3g47110 [Rhodamnia argentea]
MNCVEMESRKLLPFTPHPVIFSLCLLLPCTYFTLSHSAKLGNDTDRLALLAFKNQISHDPFATLGNWNDSVHFCRWNGVICGGRHERVVVLDLQSRNLTGTISPHIGNLTFLRKVRLRYNYFHGKIPKEMGRLYRLQAIGLTQNLLEGEIPVNLAQCSELRILDLVANSLQGRIPPELGELGKLTELGLAVNNLTGPIPKSLANLTFLSEFSLSENRLSGNIPKELGRLRQLRMFQISSNGLLTGSIPAQLFNLSLMEYFGVSENQLVGEIPPDIGFTLPNVRILLLGLNQFYGSIPNSISNASRLEWLFISFGQLTGSIPQDLGKLKNLVKLNLGMNELGNGDGNDLAFLSSLVNCTKLEVLAFNNNSLNGVLPNHITNLSSNLNYLLMGANRISGSIPNDIQKLENLILISMEENLFTGQIPASIGLMKNLQVLSIFGNKFSGEIPQSIGNLTSMVELGLNDNSLQGNIPSTLGNCQSLQRLSMANNNLSGTIPEEVIGIPSITDWLDLSANKLAGPIPLELGKMRQITYLDLSDNRLSGELPSSLVSCVSLEFLNLSGNLLKGSIPSSLKSLKGIQELDLSRNNFTGNIPDFLGSLTFLKNLNLSFNHLEGEVPEGGIFKNASEVSIAGNSNLCGGPAALHLQKCTTPRVHSRKLWRRLYVRKMIILAAAGGTCAILICSILILYRRKSVRRKKSLETIPTEDEKKFRKITYAELSRATDGFSSAKKIGTGSYGSVYKGCSGEMEVAVKVLDLQQRGASKSFIAECEALRSIRHRNLLKIVTSCSSIDFAGNEFKALVYGYMPNGSLEKWLHVDNADDQNSGRRQLSFVQRVSIAIDIAQALDYLHHHADPPVVHCDLKPSNVLLDKDMTAHVGDFGLARLLYDKNPQIQSSLSTGAFKGTIGYVAPEYGMAGEISTWGDVYSFGILVMEMFTGKKPTDEMFMEDLSLHSYVNRAIPDGVAEIVNSKLLEEVFHHQEIDRATTSRKQSKAQESLTSILKIGILCSAEQPGERLDMKEVVVQLQSLREMI